MPVTPVNSSNVFACAMALRPLVASRTSSTSWGAPGISFPSTRTTFRTSSIRWDFVWSRPAVSTRTTSVPRAFAARTASNATAEESAPSLWRTMSAPASEAHTASCSMAAARKVSEAARRTVCPSARSPLATFPIVVVFPTPFTPTTRTTNGYGGTTFNGIMRGARVSATILRKRARSASVSGSSPRRHASRSASTYSAESSAPTSARINASSSWSRTFPSTGPIPRAIAPTFMKRSSRVFARPAFSRENMPPPELSLCSLKGRFGRGSVVQFDGDGAGDPVLFHRDPVQDVGQLHRPLVVRDEEVLVPVRHLAHQGVEPVDIGVVQRRIDLVEQAEGRRLDEEDGEDEADGGERLLPAGEAAERKRFLAGRLDEDPDARLEEIFLVDQAQRGTPTLEQPGEHLAELRVDLLERLREPLPGRPVDPLDRLRQILEGFFEILLLGGQEGEPLGQLPVLLEGGEVHLSHRGHPFAELLRAGLENRKLPGRVHFPFRHLDRRQIREVNLVSLVKERVEPGDVHLDPLEVQPFRGLPFAELRLPATRHAKCRLDFRKAGDAFRERSHPRVDLLLQGRA